jgi:hypothetical protein
MAELQFEGDVFEMEDQRNWTDASFKTYSTPLRLPLPVVVERGTRIDQSVTLRVRPREGWIEAVLPAQPEVELRQPTNRWLPAIGLGLGPLPLSTEALEHLRALRLAHLRVELHLVSDEYATTLQEAAKAADALRVPLEVALTIDEAPEAALRLLRERVDALEVPVARWLVFGAGQPSTPPALVQLARERLGGSAGFGGGSDTHFTELNRNRPAVEAWDLVCYPIVSQVHAFDDLSIVETLAGQAETVASARAFVGETPVAVTPVTLRRRPRPGEQAALWPATDWRSSDDPRQASDFGAAWTLGSLATLAEAGVASVTYFDTTGPRGIMAQQGDVYPVYGVFAAVSSFAGAAVLPGVSSDPLRAVGFGLRDGTRERALVANLTAEPLVVSVRGLKPHALAQPLGRSAMDEAQRVSAGGELELRLSPFGIATIDSQP